MISLVGLDKGAVLAALYNASRPQGMGFMAYDPTPMTPEEGNEILARTTYFDYLKGRVMKVELSGDTLDPWLYDRNNGPGAAQAAIDALKSSGVNAPEIQLQHQAGKAEAGRQAREGMRDPGGIEQDGPVAVVRLGLADMKDVLGPAVRKAGG